MCAEKVRIKNTPTATTATTTATSVLCWKRNHIFLEEFFHGILQANISDNFPHCIVKLEF